MMKEKIMQDIKDAMRRNEPLRLSVLRMLSAAMKNREIEKRAKQAEVTELTDEETLAVIRQEVKKRKDAVEGFTKGGRQELAEKEAQELMILEEYVPPEMSDADVEQIVKESAESVGAKDMKDFGRVMGEAMKRAQGQASGDRVSAYVKKILNV